jgi:hypothetical protein
MSTDSFIGVEIGMVGLSEIDDLDEKIFADHDVVGGEVHVHHHLFL